MGLFPRLNEKETRKSVNKHFKMRQLHSNRRINNSPTLIGYWQQIEISYKRRHKRARQYSCHVNLIYGFAATRWFWTSNREVVGSVPWQEHSDFFSELVRVIIDRYVYWLLFSCYRDGRQVSRVSREWQYLQRNFGFSGHCPRRKFLLQTSVVKRR